MCTTCQQTPEAFDPNPNSSKLTHLFFLLLRDTLLGRLYGLAVLGEGGDLLPSNHQQRTYMGTNPPGEEKLAQRN